MRRWLWSSVLVLVCASGTVWGQTTSGGSVRGVVRDPQGAVLAGVAVVATSLAAPETYTAVTDAEGFYRLPDLPPGEFKIVASREGFSTLVREPIIVRAGMNVVVDLDLAVGGIADTVEVVGETPLLERTLPTQAVNVDGEFQRSLPLTPRRHWTDFLLLTPGVASGNLATQRMIYFVHGAGFDSQVSLVDGAEVNPAGQEYFGSVNFSTESLADVQVTTVGASAATPLGAGAVINAVTKSGTNTPSVSAMLTWQDMRWNSNNQPGGTSTRSAVVQPEVGGGGPLKKDRIWFFGSYRYSRYHEGIDRTAAQLEALGALSPGFEPFDRENISNYYFAKVSAVVAGNHRVQGFYKYDVNPLDAIGPDSAEKFARSVSGGHTGSAQLNSFFGGKVALKVTGTLNRLSNTTTLARIDVPRRTVFRSTNLVSGRLQGLAQLAQLDNVSAFSDLPGRRSVINADLTVIDAPHLGGHELQAGAYWQRLENRTFTRYVNNGFALEEHVLRDPANLAGGTVAFHRQVFEADRATTQDTTGQDLAFYVQDVWRAGPTTTISAGVRVDRIRQDERLFGLETQRSTDIGPRLGINFGVPGDAKAIVHATWARRHEGIPTSIVSAGTNALAVRDLYDLDLNGTFETTFLTPAATALLPDRVFDPDRHQPHVDDLAVGYQRQFGGSTTVDATYIHRQFADRVALVETNGIYNNGGFAGYRNPGLNDIYLVTNNEWNGQVYDALELRVSRATDRVQLIAGYTRQWRHMNGTWQPNDPASFIQPDAFANDRGIGYPRGFAIASEANALSGTTLAQYFGPTSQWRDHVINLGATIQAPWQLIVATNYNLATGPWSGPVVTRLAAPDPAFGPASIALPNGRLVSNPLATTLRFAGRDRSDGQFTLPDRQAWNIRCGRVFNVGGAKAEVSVNVLNILNNGADQSLQSGGNQLFNPNYRVFTNRQAPRSGQLFLRFGF